MEMKYQKIALFLFLVVIATFLIGCLIAKNNFALKEENKALKEEISKLKYDVAVVEVVDTSSYNQKAELVSMITSMNTVNNTKLLSNMIKNNGDTIVFFNAVFRTDIPSINKSDAISISVRGNQGEPIRGNDGKAYDLCFVVDKGIFPTCMGANNVSEITMSYNDVDFAYKNQELIQTMMQDGNITSYELSEILAKRMSYEMHAEN